MSRRKKIPTVAQHQRIGHSLKAARDLMHHAAGLIDASEGRGSDHARQLRQMVRELWDIRSTREAQLCREHPDLPELEMLHAYFGVRDRDLIDQIANSDGQGELRAMKNRHRDITAASNKTSRRDY